MLPQIAIGALISLVVTLLVVILTRTILTRPEKEATVEYPRYDLDKKLIAEHLSGAVKIPTVSMAGPEYPCQPFLDYRNYIEKTYPGFKKAAELTVVNKYSLVYSIKGSDPTLLPACFLAHIDVVPAPEEGWEVPPFSGAIKDGFVYGRGAQDMKSQMIAVLEAVEYALAHGLQIKRSIYCCFGHDEEITTCAGAPKVVEFLKSKNISFEYVLDEGGTLIAGKTFGIGGNLALIGTCEKGYMDVKITAKKPGGHASTPKKPTALASVARAIYRIEKRQLPARWTAPTKELAAKLAPHMKFLPRLVLANRDILSPILKFALAKAHPVSAALVKTTFAPTMAKGSDAANVLPPYAEAIINCRIISGETPEKVLKHIRKRAGKNITVEPAHNPKEASPISPTDTMAYERLERAIKSVFTDTKVAPYLFIAATDSRYFYPICKNVYRFTPFYFTEEDQKRVHAINERCSIEALGTAVEFFIRFIENTCL